MKELGVLCAFLVLTMIFTYPTIRCFTRCVANSGDPLLNAWILAWDVHKLITDVKGFFDTNIFYPHKNTLAYSESQLANALLAMPVLLVFRNPILAHNWVYLFSFAASGFGMYLLVKHLTGSRLAGMISGTVFAFCPYRMAHVSHVQILSTHWMPFALLFLDKSLRQQKWRDIFLFTLFFNLQALSSYYYAIFFAVAVGILLPLYLLMGRQKLQLVKLILQIGVFAAITLFINLPLARPYLELARMGFVRPKEVILLFQAALPDYLTATPENWLYGSLSAPLRGTYWSEHTSFPGVLAFIFALLGVIGGVLTAAGRAIPPAADSGTCLNKQSQINAGLLYAYVLIVSVILAMGIVYQLPGSERQISLPFRWLYDHVPGFQGLRVPSRFNAIAMLSLAVLTGYGVAWIQRYLRQVSLAWQMALSVLLVVLVGIEYLAIPLTYTAVAPARVPDVYSWLAGVEDEAVIIELPFAMTADGHPDWGAFAYVEGWRVYFSTFHWRRMVNGYSGFLPPGYQELVSETLEFPDERSLGRITEIGVNYVILHREMFDREQRARVENDLREFSAQLLPIREFGDVLVLKVVP